MHPAVNSKLGVCLALTGAISRSRTVEEIYAAALDALADGLGVSRASILLFDRDGVMRFKAYRGLSDAYRAAVEGHTPWTPETPDAQPIVVADVSRDPSLQPFLPTIEAEGIAAMAFIPLVSLGRVIGKFMLYYDVPHELGADELQLAGVVASQVAFAVERTRAEEKARQSEERLRFALDAASMGTWDWDSDDRRPFAGPPTSSGCTASRRARSTAPSPATSARFIPTIASACSRQPRARHRARRAARRRVPHRRARRHRPLGRRQGPRRVRRRAAGPHDGRLHDGDAPEGSRARAAGIGRGGQPAEGRVPRHALARAADAAQRRFWAGCRCCRPTACRPTGCAVRSTSSAATPGSRRSSSKTSSTCRGSSPASSRSIASRCCVDQLLDTAHQRRAAGGRRPSRFSISRDIVCRPAADRRRSEAPAAGARERALERHQVHARGRPGQRRSAQPAGDGVLDRGARLGRGHRAGVPALRLRSIPAGRQPRDEEARRAWTRAGARPPPRRAASGRHSRARARGSIAAPTVQIRLPAAMRLERGLAARGRPTDEQTIELRLDGSVVLVVDDQRDSRELLAALFAGVRRERFCQCDCCRSGAAGAADGRPSRAACSSPTSRCRTSTATS